MDTISKTNITPALKNRSNLKGYFKRNWPLYVMVLPMVIYLLIFSYYPMLGLQLAFKEWKPKLGIWGSPWATNENGEIDFFYNFRTLFTDDNFFVTFKNTLRISILRIVIGFPISNYFLSTSLYIVDYNFWYFNFFNRKSKCISKCNEFYIW